MAVEMGFLMCRHRHRRRRHLAKLQAKPKRHKRWLHKSSEAVHGTGSPRLVRNISRNFVRTYMRKSQASNEFYSTRGFSFLFLAFFLRFPVREFPISVRCALNLFLKVRSPGLFVRNWLSHAAKFAVTSSCHRHHHLLLISQIWRCDKRQCGKRRPY